MEDNKAIAEKTEVNPYDIERLENAGILPKINLPEGSEERINKIIEDAYNKIKEGFPE